MYRISQVLVSVFTVVTALIAGEPLADSPVVGQLIDPVQLRGVEDVILQGNRAFLPCREGQRLTICSIQDPIRPIVLGTFTHPELDQAAGLALDGDTGYLTSLGSHTLFVLDVSDTANIKLLGKVLVGERDGPRDLYKVAYRDGYCYAALQQAKRLYVIDVRDKARPQVVGEVQVTTDNDGPFSVALKDRYALVGTLFGRQNRLAVVDIQDPRQPRLIHSLFGSHLCQISGKFVGDRYVAVCWRENSLLVINVADVTRPYLEGTLVDPRLGEPNRLEVVENRAYLPMIKGNGVAVVDISSPMKLRFVASFTAPVLKKAYGVAARGHLLYVGAREGNSLVVIDRRKLEAEVAERATETRSDIAK